MQEVMKYGNNVYKRMDTDSLSRGDRAYLKEQGISEQGFKKMNPMQQHDWKDECKNPHYEHMRNFGKK